MQVRRYIWLALFLGMLLSACAGGSGSSGFDNFPSSENAAIDQALSEQECVAFHGLSICPADTTGATTPLPAPTAPPTTTPTRVPTTTPTSFVINPQPTASPTALQTRGVTAGPTATRTPTATPPAHKPHKPVVDTGINDGVIPCAPVDADNSCVFVVPFAPDGFPDGTAFRVAVRTVDPPSAWTISADATANGSPSAPAFDATVAIAAARQPSDATGHVQVAVLAFVKPPDNAPTTVANLGDSGADYAFVTSELSVQ